MTAKAPADLAHTNISRVEQHDLLAFSERPIATRQRDQVERRHAASLPKPPGPDADATPASAAATSLDTP
jgi:hypothetical protein